MAIKNSIKDLIDKLSKNISNDVGNASEDELTKISDSFNDALNDALSAFNSVSFTDEGFIKKMEDIKLDSKADQEGIKHTLDSLKSDYIDTSNLNQSEVLLRRDIFNICNQMPEMRDVIYIIRDAIIECNVAIISFHCEGTGRKTRSDDAHQEYHYSQTSHKRRNVYSYRFLCKTFCTSRSIVR